MKKCASGGSDGDKLQQAHVSFCCSNLPIYIDRVSIVSINHQSFCVVFTLKLVTLPTNSRVVQ